ncbi:epsin, partial [Strigomonas culicis]
MNVTQQLWSMKEWTRVQATGNEYVVMVHEATNEDKWGPTGKQMEEIRRAFPRGGRDIMDELQHRLKNRDKSWRACYKSLLVIDHLVRNLAESYLPEFTSRIPILRNISQTFYYTNPKGVDHGVSVRERAKNLADLLSDGMMLREERQKAAQTNAKLAKDASAGGGPDRYGGYGGYSSGGGGRPSSGRPGGYDPYRSPTTKMPVARTKEEQERYDLEMALRLQREEERRTGVSAERLEAMYSKKVEQRKKEAPARRGGGGGGGGDDEDLARRLQDEEDERARREGREMPKLRSDIQRASPPPPSAPAPATPAPAPEPPKPQVNMLDDLFAAPAAPAPPAQAAAADPFGNFLDNRAQQQNQWSQPQPQAQHQDPWGQAQ